MRLCPVKDVEDGMVLGKSIHQLNGKLLLSEGYKITPQMRDKLIERGYTHIYVMEEGTDDVVPETIISEEVSFEAKNRLANKIVDIQNQDEFRKASVKKVSDLIESGYLKNVNITYDMRTIVEEILKDITSAGSKLLNSVMIKTADTFFIDHALNVTVVSLLIGKKYRFTHKEMACLGLGAFLHDIGKIIIQQMDEAKDRKRARELYFEHPSIGYLMLNKSPDMSPLETQIVNQHHEKQNGTGFPFGLTGDNLPPVRSVGQTQKRNIFRLAEICSVANAFDNLAYNPKERTPRDPVEAIKKIILDAGEKYNKDVVQTLLNVVPYYPVGATIRVVDILDPGLRGYFGVVAKLHEDNINKPVIILTRNRFQKKIKPKVIDTSQLSRVELKLVV